MQELYYQKGDDVELGCHVDDDGVIRLRMSGNMSGDHVESLHEWASAVRLAMRTAKHKNPKRVFCIINAVGGVEADQESLAILIALVQHNKLYVTRTGVYGINFIMKNFMDIALKVTGRKNIKAFKTEKEAEYWTLTGKVENDRRV